MTQALTEDLRRFLDANPVGVLATPAADGRPRQSLVYYVRDGDRLLVSTLADRLKARDVRRSGWASVCVMGHEPPYPSAALSGPAEILTEHIGAASAAIMQRITRAAEAPEPMSDEALAEIGRVILAITVERVTAQNYIPTTTQPGRAGRRAHVSSRSSYSGCTDTKEQSCRR
jgi:PPOX class probable F420-dependent enzyme